jgi:hypothetical protein
MLDEPSIRAVDVADAELCTEVLAALAGTPPFSRAPL